MNIPEEIKKKRKSLKESQTQFGKRFGVSHASVSQWETGKVEAPYEVIKFVHDCKEAQRIIVSTCRCNCNQSQWYSLK